MSITLRRHHRRGTCSWREFTRALEQARFVLVRKHGSHAVYVHEPSGHTLALLCSGRDVPNGTLAKLLRSVRSITGLDLEF